MSLQLKLLSLACCAAPGVAQEPVHDLLAGDGAAGDGYGSDVSVSANHTLIGAPGCDASARDAGAAYVANAYDGSALRRLIATDALPGDRFGSSVAALVRYTRFLIYQRALGFVGAPGCDDNGPDAGAVYLFDLESGEQKWKSAPLDLAPGDQFGASMSAAPGFLLVGAPGSDQLGLDAGAAYLTQVSLNPNQHPLWIPTWTASDGLAGDRFGCSVDLSEPFEDIYAMAIVGASHGDGSFQDQGAAYVFGAPDFSLPANQYERLKLDSPSPTAGELFGTAVAMDRSTVLVGAPGNDDRGSDSGAAYLYALSSSSQTTFSAGPPIRLQPSRLSSGDRFGSSVALKGGIAVVGTESGNAFRFDAQTGEELDALLPPAGVIDSFGRAVAVRDGSLVVGSPLDGRNGPRSGSVQVFEARPIGPLGSTPYSTNPIPDCPCGSSPSLSEGCPNSSGMRAVLTATGSRVILRNDARFHVTQAVPNQPGMLISGALGDAAPFGKGLLFLQGPITRIEVMTTDPAGDASSASALPGLNVQLGHQELWYQFWYRDGGIGTCGQQSNLSNALKIQWV